MAALISSHILKTSLSICIKLCHSLDYTFYHFFP